MNIDEFSEIVTRAPRNNALYHFTDSRNIASIRKYGLLSKEQLECRGISVARPGGNDWSRDADARKSLNDYVNLCFSTNHPMCYLAEKEGRITKPRYLKISLEALRIPGVRVTIGVANKTDTELLEVEIGLDRLDKEVLYARTDWKDKKIRERLGLADKCEILVPKRIPIKLIGAIA